MPLQVFPLLNKNLNKKLIHDFYSLFVPDHLMEQKFSRTVIEHYQMMEKIVRSHLKLIKCKKILEQKPR